MLQIAPKSLDTIDMDIAIIPYIFVTVSIWQKTAMYQPPNWFLTFKVFLLKFMCKSNTESLLDKIFFSQFGFPVIYYNPSQSELKATKVNSYLCVTSSISP